MNSSPAASPARYTQIFKHTMDLERLKHPSFPQPKDDNEKVWRYLSFSKFINLLLTDSLYFCRVDLLNDSYEGTYTKTNAGSRFTTDKESNAYKIDVENKKRNRKTMFVNCWRIDHYESEAMWKLYCPNNEGVAIQTTYKKLASSLPNDPAIYMGLIKYIDYEEETFDSGNAFNSSMHKRKSFEHEKELRLIYPATKYWKAPNEDIIEEGFTQKVNLIENIEAIYVNPFAPQWYYDTVDLLSSKLEISFNLKWSVIKGIPYI